MTPCSTLEQRWSACRGPVYATLEQYVAQSNWCHPLYELVPANARRPCTSPRRHQCRAGTTGQLSRGLAAVLCDLHWCQAPIPGRASDWLKELDD